VVPQIFAEESLWTITDICVHDGVIHVPLGALKTELEYRYQRLLEVVYLVYKLYFLASGAFG
jgi:hypothetical protein